MPLIGFYTERRGVLNASLCRKLSAAADVRILFAEGRENRKVVPRVGDWAKIATEGPGSLTISEVERLLDARI